MAASPERSDGSEHFTFEICDAAMDQAGDVRGSGCDIFAEICEIFAGTKSVPKGATTVYDSINIAIMDVAAAKLAYDLITSTQG